MTNALILVTGATGTVGSEVVKQLVQAKQRVRVLACDPAKAKLKFGTTVEIVKGDLEDPASLRAALKEVEVAFLVSAPSERMVGQETNFIAAAETAGLPRLVKLSNIMAAPESPAPIARFHAQIESRLAKSGIPATILRPGWFMSNFLMDAQSVKTGHLYSAMENGQMAFTHPFDVAAVAVAALLDPAHSGYNYKLTGPEALSYEEAAAAFTRAFGYPVKYVRVDDASLRAALEAVTVPEVIIDEILKLGVMARRGDLELVSIAVQQVLGRPPHSLKQWIETNQNAFSK